MSTVFMGRHRGEGGKADERNLSIKAAAEHSFYIFLNYKLLLLAAVGTR